MKGKGTGALSGRGPREEESKEGGSQGQSGNQLIEDTRLRQREGGKSVLVMIVEREKGREREGEM